MASKFCNQCGSEIAPGKRFCGRCGTPVQPQTEPTAYGPTPAVTPLAAQANALKIDSPPVPVAEVSTKLLSAIPVEVSVSSLEQVESSAEPIPMFVQQRQDPAVAASPARREPTPKTRRRRFPLMVLAGALVVLLLAASVFGFYKWHNRSSDENADDTPSQNSSSEPPASTKADTPPPGPSGATTNSASLSPGKPQADMAIAGKPSPDKPADPSPNVVRPVPATPVPPPAPKSLPSSIPVATDRPIRLVPLPPPAPSPQPIPARLAPAPIVRPSAQSTDSGVLHYAGPPVHPGEEINFNGLPGVMLRFSFDHASWQPHITKHPDGTQTLTLRSLTQQDQTRCEVQWQIAR